MNNKGAEDEENKVDGAENYEIDEEEEDEEKKRKLIEEEELKRKAFDEYAEHGQKVEDFKIENDKMISTPELGKCFEQDPTLRHKRFRVKAGDSVFSTLFVSVIDDNKHFYLSMAAVNRFLDLEKKGQKVDYSLLPFRTKNTKLAKQLSTFQIDLLWGSVKSSYQVTRKIISSGGKLWFRFETPLLPGKTGKNQQKLLIVFASELTQKMFETELKSIDKNWIITTIKGEFKEYLVHDSVHYRFIFCESETKYCVYYECAPINDFKTYLSAPDSIPLNATKALTASHFPIVSDTQKHTVNGTLSKNAIDSTSKRKVTQKELMGKVSAEQFASFLERTKEWETEISKAGFKAKDTKWEWLHIYAFSYGQAQYPPDSSFHTPQDARNLVVGTANENTSMLVVESFLKGLVKKGAKVSIEADRNGIQVQSEKPTYCVCATERLDYIAKVEFAGQTMIFYCAFLPFSSSPVPLAATDFMNALANWYTNKVFTSLLDTCNQMSID